MMAALSVSLRRQSGPKRLGAPVRRVDRQAMHLGEDVGGQALDGDLAGTASAMLNLDISADRRTQQRSARSARSNHSTHGSGPRNSSMYGLTLIGLLKCTTMDER